MHSSGNTDGDNGKFGCWIRFIVDGAIKSLRIGVHEKRDLAFGGQDPNEYLPDFGPEDNTWNDKVNIAFDMGEYIVFAMFNKFSFYIY